MKRYEVLWASEPTKPIYSAKDLGYCIEHSIFTMTINKHKLEQLDYTFVQDENGEIMFTNNTTIKYEYSYELYKKTGFKNIVIQAFVLGKYYYDTFELEVDVNKGNEKMIKKVEDYFKRALDSSTRATLNKVIDDIKDENNDFNHLESDFCSDQ